MTKKELTFTAIIVGLVIGVIMTAANVYLGLYAGMTVSASIPAGVLAMGFYRGVLRRSSIYESNIVQTMASAGESLAAGIIFTIPALLIVGAWQDFQFWPTTIIAICGGLLGVVFMVPLRQVLIVESKELIYPEGIACAQVLKAGSETNDNKGFKTIIQGLVGSAVFKFFGAGFKIFNGSVEAATKLGSSVLFVGGDMSPALLAVGYIVGLEVCLQVLAGGVFAWGIAVPMLGTPEGMADASALDIAWTLWSTKVRYIGVGAMIVAGLWSLVSVRKSFAKSLGSLVLASKDKARSSVDLSFTQLFVVFLINVIFMGFLYNHLIGSAGFAILTTICMVVASFLFVAVSSYVVGLVGSSNNPVSGMTISALLGTSAFFLVFGFNGESAILSTLGVAGVVCCAACSAGDCSQDLKTGSLIGASPKAQQIAQMIGVVIPAFVIAPVLSLLHSAYGIGTGLKAPQATLFASITKALFGDGQLPMNLIIIGMVLGVIVLIIDNIALKNKSFRLHLMPIAVGIYLPVTLATPMMVGGLIKHFIEKKFPGRSEGNDNGVLLSSGFVAGEALMGVLIAILIYINIDLEIKDVSMVIKDILSLAAFALAAMFLWKKAKS